MTQEELYKRARKRVKKKREFRGHLTTYLICSVFLVILNMTTSPGYLWCLWAIGGWGMSILFHYFDAYGYPGQREEEEEIQREMDRMEYGRPQPRSGEDFLDLNQPRRERDPELRRNYDDSEFV